MGHDQRSAESHQRSLSSGIPEGRGPSQETSTTVHLEWLAQLLRLQMAELTGQRDHESPASVFVSHEVRSYDLGSQKLRLSGAQFLPREAHGQCLPR
jgi:hypothetical protein